MLELVARHLRTMRAPSVEVIEASDGEQAWDLAQAHLPDLVVLDVMMPGMSGWEVCRKIREDVSLAHTGVLMLTGIGENLNQLTSPLYGADAYIDKPFDFSDLDDKVRAALEARAGQREGVSRPVLNGVAGVAKPVKKSRASAKKSKAARKGKPAPAKRGKVAKKAPAKRESPALQKKAASKAAKAAPKAAKKAAKIVKKGAKGAAKNGTAVRASNGKTAKPAKAAKKPARKADARGKARATR